MAWTQTDTSFKKLQNKRITTSTGKGIDEEKGASSLELYLADVKTELIPGTPPGATTSVLAYTGAIGQTLAVDTSVPGNLTWFATTGYGNTTAANDGSFLSESQRLGDWVSDKYDAFGTVSGAGYEIKVYDKDSNLITKADPSDWLFDYQTGILVFNNASTTYGAVSTSGPFRIVGYRYIGSKGIIPAYYGGSGFTTYTKGDILVGVGSTFIKLNVGTNNYVLTANSSSATGLTWSPTSATGVTSINALTASIQYFSTGTSGSGFNISSTGSTHTFNIPIAGTGSTGLVSTLAQSFAGIKTFTNAVAITDSTGSGSYTSGALTVTGGVGIGGTLNVQGDLNVQGTFTTINSTTITVADKNIELGVVTSPSDLTAQGGGITLRGGTDKSINWYSGVGWSSSESWNLASGSTFKINNGIVLSSSSLGTGVTNSYLTAVGTITTGVWAGTSITSYYGGTGYQTYTTGDILVGAGSTLYKLPVGTNNFVLTADSSVAGGVKWTSVAGLSITSVNGLTASYQYFATGTSGSGFNISSSGSTHTFNIPIAGTGATGLVTTLAQSFAGTKTFTGDVIVSSTTGSTAYNTGALTVYGGLGVSGQLSFNQAALGYTGATNPSMAFIGSTNSAPITLTVLSDNSLIWEGTSGKLFGINNNLSSGWIFNVGDISGLPIIRANADGTIAMAEFAANVGIGLSNPSYKLHVLGDTNLSSGYVYRINGNQVLSSTSLGTGVTNSSLTAVGTISTGTWAATAVTARYGGTGYTGYTLGDILVGAGSTFIQLPVGINGYVLSADSSRPSGVGWTSVSAVTVSATAPSSPKNADLWFNSIDGGLLVYYQDTDTSQWVEIALGSGIDLSQSVHITSSTASTSTSTGALIVDGGVGIQGQLHTSSLVINGTYEVVAIDITLSTTATGQVIHTLDASLFRSIKYMIQISHGSDYQVQEILLLHDAVDTYLTQYAQLLSGNNLVLATYDADLSGGNMRLLVSPTYTNTTFKIYGTAVRI